MPQSVECSHWLWFLPFSPKFYYFMWFILWFCCSGSNSIQFSLTHVQHFTREFYSNFWLLGFGHEWNSQIAVLLWTSVFLHRFFWCKWLWCVEFKLILWEYFKKYVKRRQKGLRTLWTSNIPIKILITLSWKSTFPKLNHSYSITL